MSKLKYNATDQRVKCYIGSVLSVVPEVVYIYRCEAGYSGERCHLFILPVSKEVEGNSHTTALAIIAAVLSLMCLTIIGILLALRLELLLSTCTSSTVYLTIDV